jgi:hypothetical protein
LRGRSKLHGARLGEQLASRLCTASEGRSSVVEVTTQISSFGGWESGNQNPSGGSGPAARGRETERRRISDEGWLRFRRSGSAQALPIQDRILDPGIERRGNSRQRGFGTVGICDSAELLRGVAGAVREFSYRTLLTPPGVEYESGISKSKRSRDHNKDGPPSAHGELVGGWKDRAGSFEVRAPPRLDPLGVVAKDPHPDSCE